MKEDKRVIFNKVLYLFIVVIAFGFAFALLIKNQYGSNNLADVSNSKFSVKTVDGLQIVAQDLNAIYPKYYVAYLYQNGYIIHTFNYYNTSSQYELEFNRLLERIVDYNAKENMIRCFENKGNGDYNFVKENLSNIVGNTNIKVFE